MTPLLITAYIIISTTLLTKLCRDEAKSWHNNVVPWEDALLLFLFAWLWPLSIPFGFWAMAQERKAFSERWDKPYYPGGAAMKYEASVVVQIPKKRARANKKT